MIDEKYLLPVEGSNNWKKDPSTGACINTNKSEIEGARKRRLLRIKKMQEEKETRKEIESLKSELSEIKQLLKQLVEK